MDEHTVFMGTKLAHAFLGNDKVFHSFRFNPDEVSWAYQENVVSRDTIGGRVVQLLSVNIQNVTVNGRAGSRGELQRLADNVRDIMAYHVKTSRPVTFRVPSRRWNFRVYVAAMPQIGWDVSATSYPYSLNLAVLEDLSGVQSKKLESAALARLSEGIGYNPHVHGGDAKGFSKLVENILGASGAIDSVEGSGNPDDSGIGLGEVSGSNSGNIDPRDTPALQKIERALKARGMLRIGRTCGENTGAGHGFISEHVGCNAKDLMITSGGKAFGKEKEDGDAIATFLKDSMLNGTLPVQTVIWYNRSISRGESFWQSYPGIDGSGDDPSADHTNHVHVSAYPPLH